MDALLLFGFSSHLLVHLCEFFTLDGQLVERLHKILAVADGARPIFVI